MPEFAETFGDALSNPDSFVVMSTQPFQPNYPESKVSPDLFGGVGDAIRGDEAG